MMTRSRPNERWEVAKGDAIELMRGLPDGSVDLIVTDPPYESLEKHRARGTTTRLSHSKKSSNDWFQIFPNERLPELLQEAWRVLAKNRHMYIFCDDETSNVIWFNLLKMSAKGEAAGKFKWWKRIIWDKMAMGMGYHYRARYEFIIFLEKGKRKLNNLGVPDILSHKRIRGGYPTEKPTELIRELVTNSTQAGELVLDPFCGSGTAGMAALGTARRFIGFDVNDEAISVTTRRMEKV
jgi:site-specific DNA-methyltransferase (adenine-specific)